MPKQDGYQEPGPNGLKEFQVCSRGLAEARPGIRWDPLPLRTDLHVQRGADAVREEEKQEQQKSKEPAQEKREAGRETRRPGDREGSGTGIEREKEGGRTGTGRQADRVASTATVRGRWGQEKWGEPPEIQGA